MSLTNMKLTKKEAKARNEVAIDSSDRFPFGLSISLDDEALDKLGLALPKVGTEMIVIGLGKVTNVSENSGENRRKHRNVSIQLEAIEVEPASKSKTPTAVDAVSDAIKDA